MDFRRFAIYVDLMSRQAGRQLNTIRVSEVVRVVPMVGQVVAPVCETFNCVYESILVIRQNKWLIGGILLRA